MSIKISVVIPVYCVEKYLQRCIDSILKQTYTNLEIILVDDGSLDQSGAICDEYALLDERIKVIHQKNSGLSGARNTGIVNATGEFIGFIDSDDYIHEMMYSKLLHLAIDKNCDIAMCRYVRFSGERATVFNDKNENYNIYTSEEALKNLHGMDGQVYTLAWNKLYNKKLFKELKYPLDKINEDEFLTYKLIDIANQIVLSEEELYYYYQNGNSITSNSKYLRSVDIFEALSQREEYFKKKNSHEIVAIIQKAYLDRCISRYKMLLQSTEGGISDLNKISIRYRSYFNNVKNNCSGFGYRIFYYFPKGYFRILNISNIMKK